MYIGIRCPKCKAILGYVIVFSAGKADRCPHCRINLDEEMYVIPGNLFPLDATRQILLDMIL